MRKEWFEEVDGKPSRFYRLSYGMEGYGQGVDYAFRTLLAEDAAAESSRVPEPQPREWRVGDRVVTNPCQSWGRYVTSMQRLFYEEGVISEIESKNVVRVDHADGSTWNWPSSALTLVQAAGEPEVTSADIMTQGEVAILRQQLACKTSESDALIAEVERLRGFIESAYLEGWADSQDGKPCWDNSATRARLEGEA